MTDVPSDARDLERLALSIVETCVRNTGLEDLHAGVFPGSVTGDYSDVKVVSPHGEIPWNDVSRISDAEMKVLMIEVVDRVFTYLSHPEAMNGLRTGTGSWDRPKLDANMMKRVRRLQAEGFIEASKPDQV